MVGMKASRRCQGSTEMGQKGVERVASLYAVMSLRRPFQRFRGARGTGGARANHLREQLRI